MNYINDKYFLLESDSRFPLSIPTIGWQLLTNKVFHCPSGCSIYLIRANNTYYVGSDGDGDRIYDHKSRLINNRHENQYLQRVFNKYGILEFFYIPLIEIQLEYVEFRDEIENSYIKLFDTYNNGYNLAEFARTPFLNRKHTKEAIEKMSKANLGNKYCLGKECSPEKANNISLSLKGRVISKESIEKTRTKNKKFKHNDDICRKIVCVDTGKIYKSITEAVTELKLNRGNIRLCLQGKRRTCKGMKWEYLNPEDKKNSDTLRENKERNNKKLSKVKCIETGKIYRSIADAARENNLLCSNISNVCAGKRHTCGGFHWEYIKDINKHEIINSVNNVIYTGSKSKPILCLETNIIYDSINKASKMTNISRSGIIKCLRKDYHTAGGLHWQYLV